MKKIYSYIIPVDDGAAPNPFGDICTLTICKPRIRQTAKKGDWIIGTGSKKVCLRDGFTYDFSKSLVYAMKVSEVMTLPKYDSYCRCFLSAKIPNWESKKFERRMGDCIYDFSNIDQPIQRPSVHTEENMKTDISGANALLSDCFYYFGSKPVQVPSELLNIIFTNRGHKIFDASDTVLHFEKWISKFKKNKLYAEPQLQYKFEDFDSKEIRLSCAKKRFIEDLVDESC